MFRSSFMLLLVFFVGQCLGIALVYVASQGANVVPPPRFDLNWLAVLACFMFSGAFGGMVATFQWVDLQKLLEQGTTGWKSGWSLAQAMSISALGGSGGALAALYVMIVAGKIKTQPADGGLTLIRDIDALTYIATGVPAGFLGIQLLKYAAKVLLTAENADKKSDKAVEKVEGVADQAEKDREATMHEIAITLKKLNLSNAVNQATIACDHPKGSRLVQVSIADLRRNLEDFPADRDANMLLGRLLRKEGDKTGAIDSLKKGLAAMERDGTSSPVNRAALCYNIACYYCLLATEANEAHAQEERNRLLAETYSFLRRTFTLNPPDANEAATDDDFKFIWYEKQFQALLVAAGATPPARVVEGAGDSGPQTATPGTEARNEETGSDPTPENLAPTKEKSPAESTAQPQRADETRAGGERKIKKPPAKG